MALFIGLDERVLSIATFALPTMTRPSPPDAINPARTDAEKLAFVNTRQARLLEEQRQALVEKAAEDLTAGAATLDLCTTSAATLPPCSSPSLEAPWAPSTSSAKHQRGVRHPLRAPEPPRLRRQRGAPRRAARLRDLIDRGPDSPGVAWCGWCGTSSSRYAVRRQRSFVFICPPGCSLV
jgi:hypothetical protein